MSKQYYIISVKWTRPEEICFTFWGENGCGYPININNAGLYEGEDILDRYKLNEGNYPIEKSIVDRWATECETIEGKTIKILINKPFIRKQIGLNILMLDGGMGDCRASYFKDLIFPEGFKHINQEKIKKEWKGWFKVGIKDHLSEWWNWENEYKAKNHNSARYQLYKDYHWELEEMWDHENPRDRVGYGDAFVKCMSLITCKKIYQDVFAGWDK